MRSRVRPTLIGGVAAATAAVLLSACGMLVADAAMDFTLSLDPVEVTAAPGEVVEVTVTIGRVVPIGGVPMSVEATLHDPPDFVSAEPLEIPAGIDADELELSVAADAPAGVHTLEVRATNGVKTHETSLELTIATP